MDMTTAAWVDLECFAHLVVDRATQSAGTTALNLDNLSESRLRAAYLIELDSIAKLRAFIDGLLFAVTEQRPLRDEEISVLVKVDGVLHFYTRLYQAATLKHSEWKN